MYYVKISYKMHKYCKRDCMSADRQTDPICLCAYLCVKAICVCVYVMPVEKSAVLCVCVCAPMNLHIN